MSTPLVFLLLGAAFLILGAVRWVRDRGIQPASRIWLLIGTIFLVVGILLRYL